MLKETKKGIIKKMGWSVKNPGIEYQNRRLSGSKTIKSRPIDNKFSRLFPIIQKDKGYYLWAKNDNWWRSKTLEVSLSIIEDSFNG